MNLEPELRELLGRTDTAPWPGEGTAYDRFLRRRARRGRAVAAATGLAMAAALAAAVLAPRWLSSDQPAATPAGETVRVESSGFELPVPPGWRVERKLTGTRTYGPGEAPPGTPVGEPQPAVVGLALVPRPGGPRGATITVSTEGDHAHDESFDPAVVQGGSRRPDGREYRLHAGAGQGEVGRYAVFWPDYCHPLVGCSGASLPRVLAVAGSAGPGREQVLQVMETIVRTVRPITNSVPPPRRPPPPTVPATTRALLGSGGSGRTTWQLWIEPLDGNPGFAVRFPWLERRTAPAGGHWELLEPGMIQRDGTYTLMDCLTWSPGSGLLLAGLARADVAWVRFQLAEQPSVTVPTFGRDKGLPWVAYASPPLPAGSQVARVLAFDAAGQLVGSEQQEPFLGRPLCRPR
jgi:hypothetical protein